MGRVVMYLRRIVAPSFFSSYTVAISCRLSVCEVENGQGKFRVDAADGSIG